jgi:LPS sulfotransferase NodH
VSVVDDLDPLDQRHDQLPDAVDAPRLLFLCTTPRTGSHRLGRALYELGLGVPAEYFHPYSLDVLGTRWAIPGDCRAPGWLERYWQEIRRRRARNGIVAASLFGFQLSVLKRLIGPADSPVFIHLYRRSATDQIASLLTLYQTKMPYENQRMLTNIPGIGEISPRAIRILNQWLTQQNRKWRGFLADKPHLSVSSEDFFERPSAILRAILTQGNIAIAPGRVDAAAQLVSRSRAYSTNAAIKRRLIEDHAASFAALARDIDGALG